MASFCPTTLLRSPSSKASAAWPVLVGSNVVGLIESSPSIKLCGSRYHFSVPADFVVKLPAAKVLTPWATPERAPLIEDQFLVTAVIRVHAGLQYILRS